MSVIVSITNKGPARVEVVSERISEDGRERFPNGVDAVEVGETQDFVVHARQVLRVQEVPEQLVSGEVLGDSLNSNGTAEG